MFKQKPKLYYLHFVVSFQQTTLNAGRQIVKTDGNTALELKDLTVYSIEMIAKNEIKTMFEKTNPGARVINIAITNMWEIEGMGDYKQEVVNEIAKHQSN